MSRPQCIGDAGVNLEMVAVGRESDEVGVGDSFEAMLDVVVDVRRATHPARAGRAHREVECRTVVPGMHRLSPDLAQHSEPEWFDTILNDYGHRPTPRSHRDPYGQVR